MNGARRYRYYVSRKLIQGKADQTHRGWRLPAAEIERIVAVAARQLLDDQNAILDAVQSAEIASNRIRRSCRAAAHGVDAWNLPPNVLRPSSPSSIRVELFPDGFRLLLKLPIEPGPASRPADHTSVALFTLQPDADQTAGCRAAPRDQWRSAQAAPRGAGSPETNARHARISPTPQKIRQMKKAAYPSA